MWRESQINNVPNQNTAWPQILVREESELAVKGKRAEKQPF